MMGPFQVGQIQYEWGQLTRFSGQRLAISQELLIPVSLRTVRLVIRWLLPPVFPIRYAVRPGSVNKGHIEELSA
jgi:hypothetical protein